MTEAFLLLLAFCFFFCTQDYLLEDSIQFRRAMSIEEDSTDDSERVVERLLDSSRT